MKKAVLICVSGGTGSGKTTIAQKIVESLPKSVISTIVYQDSYYLDESHLTPAERAEINYDHPKEFDWVRMKKDLLQALARQPYRMPKYDFKTSKQTEDGELIGSSDVIILEGLFANYDADILEWADLRIFVDTPSDERLLRRIQRDLMERGRDFDSVAKQWRKTVRPMHKAFIEPQKEKADLIIPWYKMNYIAISVLKASIQELIAETKDS